MDNPAWVLIRNSDKVVMGVYGYQGFNVPDDHTVYYDNWPRTIGHQWYKFKVTRQDDGEYILTDELLPTYNNQ